MRRPHCVSPQGCWPARPTSGRQLDSFLSLLRPHAGGWSGCWNTLVAMVDRKLSALYYSPRGYWKGLAAIEKLASAAKVTEQQTKDWLKRQAIWQIYLPAHAAYRGRRLTLRCPTRSTRRICSFCHTTALGGKPSATLSRSLM